jgi:hypothetical protein
MASTIFKPDQLLAAMGAALCEGSAPRKALKSTKSLSCKRFDCAEGAIALEQVLQSAAPIPGLLQAKPSAFYKDSVNFYRPPPKPARKTCSCHAVCEGADAELKCYSCATFDAAGTGYYCADCFVKRHPYYRTAHHYVPIERSNDAAQELETQIYTAEMNETVDELAALLADVRHTADVLNPPPVQPTKAAARLAALVEQQQRAQQLQLGKYSKAAVQTSTAAASTAASTVTEAAAVEVCTALVAAPCMELAHVYTEEEAEIASEIALAKYTIDVYT